MGKYRIPTERYIPGKNPSPRKYVKSQQCAAMYYKGARAGFQCTWYAQKDRIYCVKHGNSPGLSTASPETKEKVHQASRDWWARLKALDKKHPGLLRSVINTDQKTETVARRKEARLEMPTPKTKDPLVLKAHNQVIAVAATLPRLPDKPFEEMEPHEQMVAITGRSLRVVYEILGFKMTVKGVPDPKIASLVKDTALRALAVRVKIDRNALAARRNDKMAELLERLTQGEKNGSGAKVIEG